MIRDDIVSHEDCMQHVYQTIEEMDDGECLMLCSGQHKGRMLGRITIGTLQSCVFKTNFWCMFVGIEGNGHR